jgi:hypothetical protein
MSNFVHFGFSQHKPFGRVVYQAKIRRDVLDDISQFAFKDAPENNHDYWISMYSGSMDMEASETMINCLGAICFRLLALDEVLAPRLKDVRYVGFSLKDNAMTYQVFDNRRGLVAYMDSLRVGPAVKTMSDGFTSPSQWR